MEFLNNKTQQYQLGKNIALVISGMSTNNTELVELHGYCAIAANDEATNGF